MHEFSMLKKENKRDQCKDNMLSGDNLPFCDDQWVWILIDQPQEKLIRILFGTQVLKILTTEKSQPLLYGRGQISLNKNY